MKISLKFKKMLTILFTVTSLFAFSTAPASAATFGPYDVTSYKVDDWGGVTVDLGSGVSTIAIDLKQWGIHAGEKADITWFVRKVGGSEYYAKRVQGDQTSSYLTLTFSGLDSPGSDYAVSWVSNTDNDMDGSYYVKISSGTVFQ